MKFIPKKKLVETVEEVVTPVESEVVEAVAKDKGYDYEAVAKVIIQELQATDEDYNYILDTVEQSSIDPTDMTPEEVDNVIATISGHYDLPEEKIKEIETAISALKSPSELKQEEEVSDLEDDHYVIDMIIQDEKIKNSYTHDLLYDVKQKLEAKIEELKLSSNNKPENTEENV